MGWMEGGGGGGGGLGRWAHSGTETEVPFSSGQTRTKAELIRPQDNAHRVFVTALVA